MLTPEQIEAENNKVKDLPVIKEIECNVETLLDNQIQIKQLIEDEREQNKAQFDEGSEKFKEVFSELKEVRNEVSAVKTQITEGFKQISQEANQRALEEKDDKIKKLSDRLDARNHIKNGVLITLIGGILLYIAIEVLKNLNVNPPSEKRIERISGD